jgi:hypothetical protein
MVDALVTTIIVVALAAAGFSGLMALLDRPPGPFHLLGLAVVELTLLVQAVVAMGRMFTGDRPDGMATFVGYLLTAVLLPPLAALFGWAERTRWGSVILAVAFLVVPVMVLRLQQVWGESG